MKIAIIGTGISGLSTAYFLHNHHDIEVFESAESIGGHTATKTVEHNGTSYDIDTGFIVFNDWTYPNFIRLLKQLKVESKATVMGFSVFDRDTGFEYAGKNLNSLFGRRIHLLSPFFLRMVWDIVRFNKQVKQQHKAGSIALDQSLGEYLEENGYSAKFKDHYLLPMGAAIWSMSTEKMLGFPVRFFAEFFVNHGLLNIRNRPTWRVISGGSKQYLKPLIKGFEDRIHCGVKIKKVTRKYESYRKELDKKQFDRKECVEIEFADGLVKTFDQVVFATHSDQAISLLSDPSEAEIDILGDIPYQENTVVLHHDDNKLPKRNQLWSSWNYQLNSNNDVSNLSYGLPVLTYNMNILQGIDSPTTFLVTLNDNKHIDPDKVLGEYTYAHPQFTLAAEKAKARWPQINGVNNTWFCGAYWFNGFHEDGVNSALRVAKAMGIRDPFEKVDPSYD